MEEVLKMKVFKSEEGKKSVLESYDKLVAQWGVDTEEIYRNEIWENPCIPGW